MSKKEAVPRVQDGNGGHRNKFEVHFVNGKACQQIGCEMREREEQGGSLEF